MSDNLEDERIWDLFKLVAPQKKIIKGHSVSTQPILAKVPRCPSPILPKKFLKLLWLV